MKGIEISKAYFEEYGRPMLEKDFSDILPYLCVGMVGSGSDCYGFDDEISRDHDFEPGFAYLFRMKTLLTDEKNSCLKEHMQSFQKSSWGLNGAL